MKEITHPQVVSALRERLGVQAGDGLLVHSAIQFLGRPAGGVGLYFDALCEAVGCGPGEEGSTLGHHAPGQQPSGTLAVPTFNFGFARGEPYDPQTTPAQGMGVFSEFFRQQPGARRTPHPLQSLAVVGRYAGDLAGRDTPGAFDPSSPFERMLELDFKLLLLGAGIQAVSFLHYCEQRRGVPYRYWKEFHGRVKTPAGWEERTYRMYARDLAADPHIELYPVQARLEARRQWLAVPLNYGQLVVCRLSDFVAAVDEFLADDPWALVANRREAEEALKHSHVNPPRAD